VLTFGEWAAGWWTWEHPYVQARLRFSDPTAPDLSRRYVDTMGRMLELYLLPHWKRTALAAITPLAIETWALGLRDGGLSGKRVNDLVSCFRTMLKEAHREGRLTFDPYVKGIVRALGSATRQRGRLTLAEVRLLFAPPKDKEPDPWKGHTLYRAVNYVAAACGMRQGEILAIRDQDVRETYLHVAHSWDPKYGLGPTKTREVRDAPCPPKVREAITPFLGSGGFVFSMDGGNRPCSGNRVTGALYAALEAIGVKDRAERNVTFHSWRHWLNSTLRVEGVPDALIRRVVGHETAQMTEEYSSYHPEDFKAVADVQARVFG
jgi:integrase